MNEKIIINGLEQYRLDKAIELYEQKKVNLNVAARLAGLPVRDFMSELESTV